MKSLVMAKLTNKNKISMDQVLTEKLSHTFYDLLAIMMDFDKKI